MLLFWALPAYCACYSPLSSRDRLKEYAISCAHAFLRIAAQNIAAKSAVINN